MMSDVTNQMSKDIETTISKICSSILFLKHHLTSFTKKDSESAKISANSLLKELDKRFDSFINNNNQKFFDGLYLEF